MDMDETLNIIEGLRCALTEKLWETAPGVLPKGVKMCFVFFGHSTNSAFWPLILHRFQLLARRCP